MQLKAGSRFKSAVCETEVIVVKAPADDVDLRIGGKPVVPHGESGDGGEVDPMHADGTLMGKRYADDELGLEILCTKPGAGSLSVGSTPLGLKDAKPLPSSD